MNHKLQIRFFVTIIFMMTVRNSFCGTPRQVVNTVSEWCATLPRGIYTLSIVQSEFACDDKYGRMARNELNFGSEARAYHYLYGQSDKRTDERLLDYFCLIDSGCFRPFLTPLWKTPENRKYSFETEQVISGQVKGTFKKVDHFVLKVFFSSTGEIQDVNVNGNRFHLRGLDFCDGTVFTLQAVKSNGNDKLLDLHIESPNYPTVSVRKYHVPFIDSTLVGVTREQNQGYFANPAIHESVVLPEVVATGRYIKPKNRMGLVPDRAIRGNDPLLQMVSTIEVLVSRFGLRKGYGYARDFGGSDGERVQVEALGRVRNGAFLPCEVMLNDNLLYGYELSDILNINPIDITQIEYFLPSNYEMYGNLAGSGGATPIQGLYGEASVRGLLMIWTKTPGSSSRLGRNKPLSVATVKQLGYLPAKTFNPKEQKVNPTKYWNPHFIPQEFDERLLIDVNLNESTNYTVSIEGVSDAGLLIHKQKIIRL